MLWLNNNESCYCYSFGSEEGELVGAFQKKSVTSGFYCPFIAVNITSAISVNLSLLSPNLAYQPDPYAFDKQGNVQGKGMFIPVQSGLCSRISRISCCSAVLLLDHLEPLGVRWGERVEVLWVLFPLSVGAWPWAVLAGRAHSLPGGAAWCSCCLKPPAQELVEPFELGDQKAGLGRISKKPVNGLGKDGFENLFRWGFYPGSCCLSVAVTDWNSLFSIFI